MIDSRSPSSDIMLNSRLFSTFLGSLVAVTIQSISRVRLFETSWIAAHQASLSFTISWNLLKFMSVESVMPSNHLILCRSLLLPENFPSIKVFVWGGQSIGASASASALPMNTQDWSFRIDWLDLLAVQGTLKSLLQHHSSKASILWHSAFFMVQPSLSYMTTGKTIALTRRTFVGKVMSLLFMLSRLVLTFLPRSKSLLISWLQSPFAVTLKPKKMKSVAQSSQLH